MAPMTFLDETTEIEARWSCNQSNHSRKPTLYEQKGKHQEQALRKSSETFICQDSRVRKHQ